MSTILLPATGHHRPPAAAASTRRPDDGASPPLVPRLLAEFIGTFFLVFTVCAAVNPKTGAGPLAPLAIGSVLMAMVFAGGHVSGGHYNPAVSLAVMIRGKLAISEWLAYTIAQLGAGAVGGLVASGLVGRGHPVATGSTGKILTVEFLFTFALAYVVLNVTTARTNEGNSYFGLAIGFTVAAGGLAAGAISGGAFNPAVAFGVSLAGILRWSAIWIYLIASVTGGGLAAFAFLSVQSAEKPDART